MDRKLLQNLDHDQKGASLIEMLVAISISVMVLGIITTSLTQFMLASRWGNDSLLVSSDLQIASIWLGRDALEAADFIPGTGTEYGTLSWEDQNQVEHQNTYSYDPAENDLIREYYQDGTLISTLSAARRIAAQGDVVFSLTDHLLTVTITSTSGDVSETAELNLALRTH
ncbi:MAG: prepilin-type N-terminal cleavage/methylation domain-containing protein [Anaerolineales bacterium]|nr:prepilin-type N-terminal cleavage/methylation domain-containing protein [Anaerolineales bacterium]MDZ7844606.1 prepilin-type N-terminal cleavage/methylation domain-containing protein [Anaerolineales bacterium]